MISQSDLFKLFRMISRRVISCDECALRFYVCSIFVDRVFVLFIYLTMEFKGLTSASHMSLQEAGYGSEEGQLGSEISGAVSGVTTPGASRLQASQSQERSTTMQRLQPDTKWHSVSIDWVSGLPPTTRGHDTIMTVVDRFSKRGMFIPCRKDMTADHLIYVFLREVIRLKGC